MRVVIVLTLGYLLVFGLALWFENKLVYPGMTAEAGWEPPPSPRVEDVTFASADGTRIHGWWLRPVTEDLTRVVLLCHGNGGNLSHRGELMRELHQQLGCGVLQFDYPGYGKSSGSPSESGCYAAGDAAMQWLANDKKLPATCVIIVGESLGGGVAVELAKRHGCQSLLLIDTFTSIPAAAKSMFWFLPCQTFMSNRFDNLSKIASLKCKIAITHGTRDYIVPFKQAEELFAAAPEPKLFVRRDGKQHCQPYDAKTWADIATFLK